MVILRGQKHTKTTRRPVVFHNNFMEYSTWNSIESPWSFHGFTHVEFHKKYSMEFPWNIFNGVVSILFYSAGSPKTPYNSFCGNTQFLLPEITNH